MSAEREYRMRYEILAVCEAIHGHVSGASDAMDGAAFDEHRLWLRYRLLHWNEPAPFTKEYDDAVRALALVALKEAKCPL